MSIRPFLCRVGLLFSLSGCVVVDANAPESLDEGAELELGRSDQAASVPVVSYVTMDRVRNPQPTASLAGGFAYARVGAPPVVGTNPSPYPNTGIVSTGISDLGFSVAAPTLQKLVPVLEDVGSGVARPVGLDVGFCENGGCMKRRITGKLTELTFPALDGSSREAARISAKLAVSSSEAFPEPEPQPVVERVTESLASNFRFELDDLPPTIVSRIEPFSIRIDPTTGRASVTNLKVTVAEQDAEEWLEWYRQMVAAPCTNPGTPGCTIPSSGALEGLEKTARIVLLASNLRSTVLTVTLHGVGILGFEPVPVSATDRSINRVTFELYFEKATIQ
jgi:hypothetical protein